MDAFTNQKKVLRGIFEKKDKDKSGYIDAEELEKCLLIVGFCPTPDDLQFLIKHFDQNGDGKLQIDELLDNLNVIDAHSLHGDDLMDAFKALDVNPQGYISSENLMTILTAKGPHQMSPHNASTLLRHLLRDFDKNCDGKFSYSEFVDIFLQGALEMSIT